MFETRVEIVSDYSISDLETKINAALKKIREANPNAKLIDIKPWPDSNNIPTYVESEITISQSKMESRLCEDWSIPSDY